MRAKMSRILRDLYREFGWKSRLYGMLAPWYVLPKIRREEKRLAEGWTYEPPTFYERNEHCTDRPDLPVCQCCTPLEPAIAERLQDVAAAPSTTKAPHAKGSKQDSLVAS